MKNVIIVSLMLFSMAVCAQKGERPHKREAHKNLSAEEAATLQTKQMTLDLVLDKAQAEKIYPILLDQTKAHKARVAARMAQEEKPKLTKTERYERANEHLDNRIALQNKMKGILTDAQFEKFTEMESRNEKKRKHRRKMKNKKGRRPFKK